MPVATMAGQTNFGRLSSGRKMTSTPAMATSDYKDLFNTDLNLFNGAFSIRLCSRTAGSCSVIDGFWEEMLSGACQGTP